MDIIKLNSVSHKILTRYSNLNFMCPLYKRKTEGARTTSSPGPFAFDGGTASGLRLWVELLVLLFHKNYGIDLKIRRLPTTASFKDIRSPPLICKSRL